MRSCARPLTRWSGKQIHWTRSRAHTCEHFWAWLTTCWKVGKSKYYIHITHYIYWLMLAHILILYGLSVLIWSIQNGTPAILHYSSSIFLARWATFDSVSSPFVLRRDARNRHTHTHTHILVTTISLSKRFRWLYVYVSLEINAFAPVLFVWTEWYGDMTKCQNK